jgi:hypothetical protein
MSTKKQIIELLKEKGIKGYSKKNKAELLVLLNEGKPQEPKVKKEKVKNFEDKTLKTEDTGKIAEMAVCLFYDIPFEGEFKYDMDEAKRISKLIPSSLKEEWAEECEHTATIKGKQDFTSPDGKYLSLKSNKESGRMLAPQFIGQPTRKSFREKLNIPQPEEDTYDDLKEYAVKNVISLLKLYWKHAFNTHLLYYSEKDDSFTLFEPKKCPNFKKGEITFTKQGDKWLESTSLRWKNIPIGEFQCQNGRNCFKFRWNKNVLDF